MKKARLINAMVAIVILVALSLNAACESNGWPLVGDIFGWSLLIGGSFLVVDNYIKERVDQ